MSLGRVSAARIAHIFAISSVLILASQNSSIALTVDPSITTNFPVPSLSDYGTPLGSGLALVAKDSTQDVSKPVVPRAGVSPSESPIIEASINQILAPIIKSLPKNTAFSTSILINGHAVKYSSNRTNTSSSVTMPAFVGTREGTFLFQMTSKRSKYFYKVMFTPDM